MVRFFFYLFFLFPSVTQALDVKASVSAKELGLNESLLFKVRIEYEGDSLERIDPPDLSQLKDFYLLGQEQHQESSVQILNGKMNKVNAYVFRYRLQPKKTGVFKIPPFTMKVNRQNFQTQNFVITVTKESQKKRPSKTQQNFPFSFPDPFNNRGLFDIFSDPFENIKEEKRDIKLQTRLDKKSFYRWEMFSVDWFILQSSSIPLNYNVHSYPKLKGFWKEELKDKKNKAFQKTEIIDKVLYRKILLNSFWLFPLQTGELVIDPYSIQIIPSFSFRSQRGVKTFPSRKVTVKPLPKEGLEKHFTGAVGVFKVQAEFKDQSAVVNQPLSYKISFKGLGHPRFIDLPKIPFPSSVQVYPSVEKSSFSDLGQSEKTFEIVFVPKKEGLLEIPSFQLSTFNPIREKYEIHSSTLR